MKRRIPTELVKLTRIPDSGQQAWLNSARDSAKYLVENFKSDEIILYANGPHLHAQTVLVDIAKISPLDADDLDRANIDDDDTWHIEHVCFEGEHYINLKPPMENFSCKSLVGSEKLVFVRKIEGVDRPKLPIEINQKFIHALSLHFFEERDAFCRIDEFGNHEDVIKIYRGEKLKDLHVVSMARANLEDYMAITNQALFCRFYAIRSTPDNLEFWNDYDENLHEDIDMRFRERVIKDKKSYAEGWLILRPSLTKDQIIENWKAEENNKVKQYATFIVYDRKNKRILETSCGPGHTVNYSEEDSDLPWEVSPAFFNAEVLHKYKADPEKYHITDSRIDCRGSDSWYLNAYDINEAGQVHAYICDLRTLPYKEQLYWKSFNEKPKSPISKRAFQQDILGQFSDVEDPLSDIKETIRKLDGQAPFWWKFRGSELMDATLYLATDSVLEWGQSIIALDQMVVEGFLAKELQKICDANNGKYEKNWASLKMLIACLISLGQEEAIAEKTVAPLRDLNHLRNKVSAHGNPKEKAEIAHQSRMNHGTLRNHFRVLTGRVSAALTAISKSLPDRLDKLALKNNG